MSHTVSHSQHSTIRCAQKADIHALLSVENTCFTTDKLSKRSFQHFIKTGSHDLWVIEQNTPDQPAEIIGYALVLYRTGTNLARLYSIALLPNQQGKGYAQQLLNHVQQQVSQKYCVYMRLEVNIANQAALKLYQKNGYKVISQIEDYYEDGSAALRMEKRLHASASKTSKPKPYYQQTTDFTCGPASLMMAIKTLQNDYEFSRHEELQIWREATTIFMTSGHGGCSPHGLALSAWRRGRKVQLYLNRDDVPFIDGVRGEEKKAVIELVHQEFLNQIAHTDIELQIHNLETEELNAILQTESPVLALISTWRLNRNKAPHWIYVTASDENFVYINDPEPIESEHLNQTDFEQIPISKQAFAQMARFGQKKLRALLKIS